LKCQWVETFGYNKDSVEIKQELNFMTNWSATTQITILLIMKPGIKFTEREEISPIYIF